MIRARLEQDLAPLCGVLDELAWPPAAGSEADRLSWLRADDAVESWVFDSAPVTVAPTRNVVGHVQVLRPSAQERSEVEACGHGHETVLMIGRLFVRPSAYAEGIRRFLLTQAVALVRDSGGVAVLEPAANPGLTRSMCERRGFVSLAGSDGELMVDVGQ